MWSSLTPASAPLLLYVQSPRALLLNVFVARPHSAHGVRRHVASTRETTSAAITDANCRSLLQGHRRPVGYVETRCWDVLQQGVHRGSSGHINFEPACSDELTTDDTPTEKNRRAFVVASYTRQTIWPGIQHLFDAEAGGTVVVDAHAVEEAVPLMMHRAVAETRPRAHHCQSQAEGTQRVSSAGEERVTRTAVRENDKGCGGANEKSDRGQPLNFKVESLRASVRLLREPG